jgi:AbiV family abortive infection protein
MSAPKRRYRNNLDFVEAGFRACWTNAKELVAASDELIHEGLHAPALSLAVLALEEIGKLCSVDGLLFARAGDGKSQRFDKSQRDHETKLRVVPLLPVLITNLTRVDPRFKKDPAYAEALGVNLRGWQTDRNKLFQRMQQDDFAAALNSWKQRGFYVSAERGTVITPREAVGLELAQTIHRFAWRSIGALDFVLKDGNLERYMEQAKSVRAEMTESDHQTLEAMATEILIGGDEGLEAATFGVTGRQFSS